MRISDWSSDVCSTDLGFYQPSQDLVNSFKTHPATGLPYLENYNTNPVKNDMGITSGDPFTPYTGTLDPRLDWTVGRRGLPYLDWGLHEGQSWVRLQSYAGQYSPKTYVYWQETQETNADQSSWAPDTANNVLIIDRKSVVLGRSGSVRVDTGGRGCRKKKT